MADRHRSAPTSQGAEIVRTALMALRSSEPILWVRERAGRGKGLIEHLRDVVNAHCTCGGSGPNDPGACEACLIWHVFLDDVRGVR